MVDVEVKETGYVLGRRRARKRNKSRVRYKKWASEHQSYYESSSDEVRVWNLPDIVFASTSTAVPSGWEIRLEMSNVGSAEMSAGQTPPSQETCAPVETYIAPLAYLRSVWAIIRETICHPFSTTVIDLSTGEAVSFTPEDTEVDSSHEEAS